MTAVKDDWVVEAGATFTRAYRYLQPADPDTGVRAPVVLTGFTAKLQLRAAPAAATTLLDIEPPIDVPTGTITVTLTAAQTATLTATGAVFALALIHSSGEPVIRLVRGKVMVDPETVR